MIIQDEIAQGFSSQFYCTKFLSSTFICLYSCLSNHAIIVGTDRFHLDQNLRVGRLVGWRNTGWLNILYQGKRHGGVGG